MVVVLRVLSSSQKYGWYCSGKLGVFASGESKRRPLLSNHYLRL